MTRTSWSSSFAFYLSSVGAAVGLGSIWRFPYLAGADGGGAFIVIFVGALILITMPLLVAEFLIGRKAQRSAPMAAGEVARRSGRSRAWNAIGFVGTAAVFIVLSYYTLIAGWVVAYAWKCARGDLLHQSPAAVAALWRDFLADPLQMGAWHLAFLALIAFISARGVNRGIELANRIRAPALLFLLLLLAGYSLVVGNARQGLSFAFGLRLDQVTPQVVLAAIGQAFFATGVGLAMMIAYGQYVSRGTSLLRAAFSIVGSILLVSLLATLVVFPLVFRYGLNPSQGTTLVFDVLPNAFAEMPAGRWLGTAFFILLGFAALTPSLASLEPAVAWLTERTHWSRTGAVWVTTAAAWLLGLLSLLSFNRLAHWYPLDVLPYFANKTFFEAADEIAANWLAPVGAFLTSILVGWRLRPQTVDEELREIAPLWRRICLVLLRYLCPVAIAWVVAAAIL